VACVSDTDWRVGERSLGGRPGNPPNQVGSNPVQELGRRERKKLATRRALEESAMRLFTDKGFDGTTVEEIADAADVSARTFFRYFATKDEVLFGDHEPRLEAMRALLEQRPAD